MVFIIAQWWMSQKTRWAAVHAQKPQTSSVVWPSGNNLFFFTKTYATLASGSVLLIDGGSEEGTRFTAKSLAIVCAFLMDALPLVVKWPTWPKALTSTGSRQARVEVTPAQRELTSQYERAAALRRMDSISGPIAFSLTRFQGDLQPCTDRAKVKGRGSD